MVEFCTACGTSLPKGDLTVRGGELFTSHDYVCPSCHQPANPGEEPAQAPPEAGHGQDLVIRKGSVGKE